jgi:hypothetical protein
LCKFGLKLIEGIGLRRDNAGFNGPTILQLSQQKQQSRAIRRLLRICAPPMTKELLNSFLAKVIEWHPALLHPPIEGSQ